MGKLILIFSDGTGQIGGMRPDQRLSNIYKLYRATRPGPDSPIKLSQQVAFYDAGLGAGEVGGLTLRRVRNVLASAVGTGIDENVIDCYAAIIAAYEPGDRICLFGFSRGAYTVRTVANVLNVCGVPTHAGDGGPVPRFGPALRKIASDGVKFVYNHGAGRSRSKYEIEREKKASRFRAKYGSEGIGADGEAQGNIQPEFIGVFDSVAALGSRSATLLALAGFAAMLAAAYYSWFAWPWWVTAIVAAAPALSLFWVLRVLSDQIKYFYPDRARPRRWWDPRDWTSFIPSVHVAWWSGKHYDLYVDREIPTLRHALSIDESRTKFPRVPWGRPEDGAWNDARGNADWMIQTWFAGNHSDIGGSYPEEESRLSDVALQWMVDEFRKAVPEVVIRPDLLNPAPDGLGLQHDERQAILDIQPGWLRAITFNRLTWTKTLRSVRVGRLHPTVLDRFAASAVPQMDQVRPYRPENLREHPTVKDFYT